MARRVEVEFTGDSKQLKRAAQDSSQSVQKFARDVKTSTKSAAQDVDHLSGSFDRLRQSGRESLSARGFRQAASGALKVAGGAFALTTGLNTAAVASSHLTGENTQLTHGLGDAASAFSSLLSLDPEGFFQATQGGAKRTEAAVKAYSAGLTDANQATDALRVATALQNAGFEESADELRKQVSLLQAAAAGVAALDFSQRQYNLTIINGTAYWVAYKGAHDAAMGGRTTGPQIYGRNTTRPPLKPLSPSQRRDLSLIPLEGTERLPILRTYLAALKDQRDTFKARGAPGGVEAWLALLTKIKTVYKEIGDITEADAKTQAAANKARKAAAISAQKDRTEALRKKRDARQFRALGLGPTGGEFVPTVANLRKQFGQIKANAPAITKEMRKHFPGISKLLFGDEHLSPDVRRAIASMFDDWRKEWAKGAQKMVAVRGVNAGAILKGLGLSPEQTRAIMNRLAGVNVKGKALAPGGGASGAYGIAFGTRHAPADVYLDGQKVGTVVKRQGQRDRIHSPRQKRGPNAGR